ncbi:MAG: hypothetical protein ACRCSF_02360 [Mycobacteriaceae bacterium]
MKNSDKTKNQSTQAVNPGAVEKALINVVDHGSRLQAPAVTNYVNRLRQAHPDEMPKDILARLESRYLTAVTASGATAGATAAVPGIGTLASIAAVGTETAFFMEATALYALAVATVHGIPAVNAEHRRALILAIVLGDSGMAAVEKVLGKKVVGGAIQGGNGWISALKGSIPTPTLSALNKKLFKKFVTKFAAKRSALVVGKLLPAGVGAAIGGGGNRLMGKAVIASAHNAFGTPPADWVTDKTLR